MGSIGESKNVNSADQIDQLNDLRFKTQMPQWQVSTYQERDKRGKLWKSKCPVRGVPKDETYKKCGAAAREVEIGAVGNKGRCWEFIFGDTVWRILIWWKICVRREK